MDFLSRERIMTYGIKGLQKLETKGFEGFNIDILLCSFKGIRYTFFSAK